MLACIDEIKEAIGWIAEFLTSIGIIGAAFLAWSHLRYKVVSKIDEIKVFDADGKSPFCRVDFSVSNKGLIPYEPIFFYVEIVGAPMLLDEDAGRIFAEESDKHQAFEGSSFVYREPGFIVYPANTERNSFEFYLPEDCPKHFTVKISSPTDNDVNYSGFTRNTRDRYGENISQEVIDKFISSDQRTSISCDFYDLSKKVHCEKMF